MNLLLYNIWENSKKVNRIVALWEIVYQQETNQCNSGVYLI